MSDALPPGFTVEPHKCNSVYHVVKYGEESIGSYQVILTGGYLVLGKRNPVPTLYDAAIQMLETRLKRCRTEEATLRKIRDRLRRAAGGKDGG